MSQLADLLPVAQDLAQEVMLADVPSEQFGGRDVKGLGFVALERLAIRCGAPEAGALEALAYAEDRAVFLVPSQLSSAAREWSDDEIASHGEWWAQLEEHEGLPIDWITSTLEALRAVAAAAESQGVDVLYWMAV